jgi:aldose sugar dehydrogenase
MPIHIVLVLSVLCLSVGCRQESATDVPTALMDRSPNIQPVGFKVLKEGLTLPWDVSWGPDGWVWVTESSMNLLRINPETGESQVVTIDIDGLSEGLFEHFMHGLEFHPDFDDSPFVYVSYLLVPEHNDSTGYLSVVRLRYDASRRVLGEQLYFLKDVSVEGSYLPGGRMLIHDRYLFVCTADEREVDGTAQDTSTIVGNILRFNLDGSVPADNPLPSSPIWSWGHRNPQGLTVTDRNELLAFEHGPTEADELNLILPGRNYGWPLVRGFCDTETEDHLCRSLNLAEPLYEWTPTIAPGSLLFYDSDRYPQWKGMLLASTLKEADLRLLAWQDGRIEEKAIMLDEKFGRIRDLCSSPDGRVFLITFNKIPSKHQVKYKPLRDSTLHYEVLVEIWPDSFSSIGQSPNP